MKIPGTKRQGVLVVWLAIMLLAVIYLGNNLKVLSDISQFMPDYGEEDQRLALMLDELKQGQTSKLLFIRLRSETPEETASLSKALKQQLLKSGFFESAINGQIDFDVTDFHQLFQYRYLLSPTSTEQKFSVSTLQLALNARLNEIQAGMGMMVKQTLSADPTNSFIGYLRNAKQWGEPKKLYGVWFTPDNQSTLLIANVEQQGFDLDNQQKAISFIELSVKNLANGRAVKIDISGPGTFAVATREKIQQALVKLSVVGGSLIIIIMLLAYRSLPLVLLVVLPLASAVIMGMALTNLVFGSIHGITLAFGITLLGVCLDYPIHLFSHLRENQPARNTLKTIWPTLRLGVLTTSLGYLILLWSGFSGLAQLAVFAVVGLWVALAVTRWVLPDWIPAHSRPEKPAGWLTRIREQEWRSRYGVLASLIIGGMAAALLLSQGETIWEKDISALSPIPAETRLLDRQLRQQTGAPDVNHVFILTNKNPETLLQETEKLESSLQPLLEKKVAQHIFSVADLLPSQALQRERQTRLPRRAELEASVQHAVQGLPFKSGLFDTFIQGVELSRTLSPLTREDLQATPLARLVNSSFFLRRGQWVSIIRLAGVPDETALSGWLENHPAERRAYLNLHQTASALVNHYRDDAVFWLLSGGLAMILVLLLFSRSFSTTARVLLAPLLAVAVSLGAQVALGAQLNLFHLLSVLLVIGIGVDYSLFFNRTIQDRLDQRQSLHGVVVGASSTLAAFGVLVFSGIPVMVAIGQTVAIGVLASFVLALLSAKTRYA